MKKVLHVYNVVKFVDLCWSNTDDVSGNNSGISSQCVTVKISVSCTVGQCGTMEPWQHDRPGQEILMIATGNRGLLTQHKQFLDMARTRTRKRFRVCVLHF